MVSLLVTAGISALLALIALFQGNSPDLARLSSGALIWTFFLFLFFGGLRLLSYSRPAQDRAFTITGFVATFFGLGMLVIFFIGIFQDVSHWFQYIPRLVQKQNEDTLQAREELKDIKAVMEKARQKVEKDYKEEKAQARAKLMEAFKETKDPGAAQLLKDIEKAEKSKEDLEKALGPLVKEYQSEVKAAAKDYAQVLGKKTKAFAADLDQLIKAYPDFIQKAIAGKKDPKYLKATLEKRQKELEEVRQVFDGTGEVFMGFAKFYKAYQTLESVAFMPKGVTDKAITNSADGLRETLVVLKNLNEQKAGNEGTYPIEKSYQDALAAAPAEKVRAKLRAIRKVQEAFDGQEGIFRTKEGFQKALALAGKDSAVKEKLEALHQDVFEMYEGFAGVYDSKLADFQKDYAEKKKVADLPLRDTSLLGVLTHFLFQAPSNTPQDAGIWPALLGSLWIALITILFAVPVGVGAALYLEEYKHSGWLGHIIQVNINNLAGVPSVVYSILGAFIFVDLIFKPLAAGESGISPRNLIGGGLTLGLLTLPVIIVSAQEAIKAVPSSIRQGAYALGATHWQVIWRQVLPLARPGILTGTILAVSRAIGEAAPLVLFGALQFVDVNPTPFSGFTVMPMQIYNWAERPYVEVPGEVERLPVWHYNAALASLILLTMLLLLNGLAIYLRNRAQKTVRVY